MEDNQEPRIPRGKGYRTGPDPALRNPAGDAGTRLRPGYGMAEGVRGTLPVRGNGRPASRHRGYET